MTTTSPAFGPMHKCCDPTCPGLPWRASDHRHPCGSTPADPPLGSLILSDLDAEEDTELGRTWAATTEEAP